MLKKIKKWLIKKLGGYTEPFCQMTMTRENIKLIPLATDLLIDKDMYSEESLYKEYVEQELARKFAEKLINYKLIKTTVIPVENYYSIHAQCKVADTRGEWND